MTKALISILLTSFYSLSVWAGKEIPVIQVLNPTSLEYNHQLGGHQVHTTPDEIQLLNYKLRDSSIYFNVNPKSPLLQKIDCVHHQCLVFGFVINDSQVGAMLQIVPIPFSTKQETVVVPVGRLTDQDQIRFDVPAEVIKVKRAFNLCLMGCGEKAPDRVYIRLF
jgi:hypothetical protein